MTGWRVEGCGHGCKSCWSIVFFNLYCGEKKTLCESFFEPLNFSAHLFSKLVDSDLVQEEINNHEQLQHLIEWFSSTYVGGIVCLFMRIVKEMLRGPLNLKSVVYFSQICPLPLLSSNQLNKN